LNELYFFFPAPPRFFLGQKEKERRERREREIEKREIERDRERRERDERENAPALCLKCMISPSTTYHEV